MKKELNHPSQQMPRAQHGGAQTIGRRKMNPRRIKEGTWPYAGPSPARVFIEEVDFRPGSGDQEDFEEEREDHVGHFFRIDYKTAGSRTISSGGYFASLEEAMRQAEKACSGVAWDHREPFQPPPTTTGSPAPDRV